MRFLLQNGFRKCCCSRSCMYGLIHVYVCSHAAPPALHVSSYDLCMYVCIYACLCAYARVSSQLLLRRSVVLPFYFRVKLNMKINVNIIEMATTQPANAAPQLNYINDGIICELFSRYSVTIMRDLSNLRTINDTDRNY